MHIPCDIPGDIDRPTGVGRSRRVPESDSPSRLRIPRAQEGIGYWPCQPPFNTS